MVTFLWNPGLEAYQRCQFRGAETAVVVQEGGQGGGAGRSITTQEDVGYLT